MNGSVASSLVGATSQRLWQLRSCFRTDISKLVLGSTMGRCIAAAMLPVLTRIFSADDFLVFGSFMAIVTTIAVVACLRLEVLVPLVESEKEAAGLFVLSSAAAAAVAVLAGLSVFMPLHWGIGIQGARQNGWFAALIPFAVLATGLQSVCRAWATRRRRFRSIAFGRASQSATGAAVSAITGALGVEAIGLVLGSLANVVVGCGRFLYEITTRDRQSFVGQSLGSLHATFIRHKRHAVLSSLEAGGAVAGVQMPLLAIAQWSSPDAGHLCLALQILAVPMTLLGSGVGQVYLSRAGRAKASGSLALLTLDSIRTLLMGGVGPMLLGGLLAPYIVPIALGHRWIRTGELVMILTPCVAMQLITLPVLSSLYLTHNQRAMLILAMVGVAMRLGATCAVAWLGYPGLMVYAFAAASLVYYAVQLMAVCRATDITVAQVHRYFVRSLNEKH